MVSSSSTINSPKYDVFLSFRGADTRNNFTSHLYNALRQAGVNVFMDKELKRGEEISSTLFLMIEESQVSVVIFSPKYAASKFCLDELVKILECKASKQQVVLPVFYSVDPFEVEKLTGKYGKYISRHEAQYKGFKRLFHSKKTIKVKTEKVKKWKSALAQTADLAGWDLRNRDEAEIIREIIERVLQKLESSPLPSSKEVFPEKRLVGVNFEIDKGDIWQWLTADDVSSIGIWGMGGVGKTTLMIHIYNKLMENQEVSDQVYWVTVSQDFNVYKLQNLIAKEVGLDFGNEYEVMKRAARLLNVLSSKGKFVLILDNLWNNFDAEALGIPIKTKGCKLIITTRILDVCTKMSLQKIKKIEPLSEKDAWYLFNETLGHDLAMNVEKIAKSIVRECDGLPLGIVTIAGSMREVNDILEWKHALTELQRSEQWPEDMGDNVFRILRFSYARLDNCALQKCILYCALFPEDNEINREELIELLFVEGIIEQGMSRQMNFNKGHVMLNKLVKVSLLEDVRGEGGVRYIKMHDLIRDMAIQITGEHSPSIIEAGRQLKHMPEERYWTGEIVRVSLMSNGINEIPSHYSPMCSSLSTLFLSQNWNLKSIPDSFFGRFHGLKVLDLSFTGIEKLPESVGCLANLRALLLRVCRDLCSMPSIEKLVSLEILDLVSCWALQKLPEGMESLSNLTFLNLYDSGLNKLQPGMLPWRSHLQFLALDTYFGVKAEELAELQKLEFLYCCFHNFLEYRTYIQLVSLNQKQPINYFLSVGGESKHNSFEYTDRPHSQEVDISNCSICRKVFILKDVQILRMKGATFYHGYSLRLETAATEGKSSESELKSLSISDCADIRYLFHFSSSPSILESLEALELDYLPNMRALFGRDERAPSTSRQLLPNDTTFSKLKRLIISRSHTMKSLCTPRLFSNFRNLEDIVVEDCSEMEKVIAATEDEASYGYDPSCTPRLSSNFQNLEDVEDDCSEMEEIKAATKDEASYGYYPSGTPRLSSNFQNLKDIVGDYSEMDKIKEETEDEESNGYDPSNSFHETLHFNLPKLRSFTLKKLPKLERICSEQIVCDSLQQFTIEDCKSLRNIPISLPLPSLKPIRVRPKEWWYSVQWGNPDQKGILQPEF